MSKLDELRKRAANRREWDPSPGSMLAGTITRISERESQYGWFPVLLITDEDGAEWEVRCASAGLYEPIAAARPSTDDLIAIHFVAEEQLDNGNKVRRFTVALENDAPTAVDWDRMAKSRKEARRPAAGPTGMVDEQWAATLADDEPPSE